MNFDTTAQDFQLMKKVDNQYGEKMKVTKPKKQKEKHRIDFSHMSVEEILAMEYYG